MCNRVPEESCGNNSRVAFYHIIDEKSFSSLRLSNVKLKIRKAYSESAVHKSKQTHKESLVGVLSSHRFSLQKEGNYAATERHIDFRWIINFFSYRMPSTPPRSRANTKKCLLAIEVHHVYIQYRWKWIEGEGSRTWNSISIRHALGLKNAYRNPLKGIRSFITHSGWMKNFS